MAKLTKRLVDAAELPEGSSKTWSWIGDDEVPGFGVKVYPTGRKSFALRYRTQSGRQRMITLGPFGTLTVQQARKQARKEKVRVLEGADPQAERQREAVAVGTVKELMDRWIKDYAKAHRRRWKGDESRINRNILPRLGKLHLEDLTPDVLASWHRKLGQDTPVEANRCLQTVRAAWRWADREGLLPETLSDPTAKVQTFRERSRDRWLKKAEVKRLMKATAKEDDPYVRTAVPLFLLTGLRKRELLGAKWSDVDLDRGEIRLPQTKAGDAQVRILPDAAIQLLSDLPRAKESPYVFPSPANPKKPRDDIKKPWARIREVADLKDITLHDLRRTAGSHMAQAGVPLQVIAEVLGHSHPGVTKLYARLSSENEREALKTLSESLSGVLGLQGSDEDGDTLPQQLRALLDATGDDPDALAKGLRELGLGKPVDA